MVSFSDDFERQNRELNGDNGWAVMKTGEASATDGSAEILNEYATNSSGASGSVVLCVQDSTAANIPTTAEQKVVAFVTSTAQAASDQYIDIGVGSGGTAVSFANSEPGIWIRLEYGSNGLRTVSIREDIGTGSELTLQSTTLVAAGTVVQTGYDGRLLDDGATQTVQELKLIVTDETSGMRIRGYVNQPDDDLPTIEARSKSSWVASTTGTNDFGYFFFRFGATTTANSLAVSYFSGEDYSLPDRKKVLMHPDWATLAEVRERVERKHTGAANVTLNAELLDEFINDALDELILDAGDLAWWLIETDAALALTFDTDGFSTLPRYIKRLLHLEHQSNRGETMWRFHHLGSDGSLVIRKDYRSDTTGGNTYVATYLLRHERVSADESQLPFPREHLELLVYGVVKRLAERDRSQEWFMATSQDYTRLLGHLRRDLARHADQQRVAMRPRRRPFSMWRNRPVGMP